MEDIRLTYNNDIVTMLSLFNEYNKYMERTIIELKDGLEEVMLKSKMIYILCTPITNLKITKLEITEYGQKEISLHLTCNTSICSADEEKEVYLTSKQNARLEKIDKVDIIHTNDNSTSFIYRELNIINNFLIDFCKKHNCYLEDLYHYIYRLDSGHILTSDKNMSNEKLEISIDTDNIEYETLYPIMKKDYKMEIINQDKTKNKHNSFRIYDIDNIDRETFPDKILTAYYIDINNIPKHFQKFLIKFYNPFVELDNGKLIPVKKIENKKVDSVALVYQDKNKKRNRLGKLKENLVLLRLKKDKPLLEEKSPNLLEDKKLIEADHTEEIKNSIKNMLLELKKNNADIVNKIEITNSIFFKYNKDRKEIDDFFKDNEILKYCDLSNIDFTNALLEGVDLSNTNAKIDLTKIYNKSIKNTKLKNVNLMNQTLDGILCDNADLRGTYVFVNLDKASITNTLFSTSSIFYYGSNIVDVNTLKNMGIKVFEEEKEIKLELR